LRRLYPHTAVVLATGVTTVPPRVSMQAGVLAYLVKPFAKQALVQALTTAVQWVDDTQATGPRPEDQGQAVTDWLDQLRDI
jgi:FixJ family two-component response regulator